MTEPAAKRSPAWKIAGIVIGVILLSCIALAMWASSAASARFDRIRAKGRARLAEVKAQDPRRPVLRGSAEKGNAWDDYSAAVAELKKFADAKKFHDLVQRTPKAEPEVAKAALAAHGAAIDLLRRGAGRDSSRYPYDWDKGINMTLPALVDNQMLSNFAILKARALAEEGKGRDAVGVLLDDCQFGRDLASDGVLLSEMSGIAILGSAVTELRDLLASGRLDKPALEDLARGMEILDGSFPKHGEALVNDVVLLGGSLSLEEGWGPQRLYLAMGIDELNGWMERVAAAEALSWAEARKAYAGVEADVEKSSNPVSKIAMPNLDKTARTCRERRGQLRLLRAGAVFLASGVVPDLDDPFGSKLRSSSAGSPVKLWSVGADGTDDGGDGQWKASDGKDIVLELKKQGEPR